MNCEDVPMGEWDKLTGAEQESLEASLSAQHEEAVLEFCRKAFPLA